MDWPAGGLLLRTPDGEHSAEQYAARMGIVDASDVGTRSVLHPLAATMPAGPSTRGTKRNVANVSVRRAAPGAVNKD